MENIEKSSLGTLAWRKNYIRYYKCKVLEKYIYNMETF